MFKVGDEVICVFRGRHDYYEASRGKIGKVEGAVAYFNEEWGTTYDTSTGRELENFFNGMSKFLVRSSELDKHEKAAVIKSALEESESDED